ncbi:MAG: hypothetical protein ACYCQI_02480 [Gammaproteobacteria bacterium]
MKNFFKTLLLSTLLLVVNNVFANNLVCPGMKDMRNVQFLGALPLGEYLDKVWLLFSLPISDAWNIEFLVKLPNATNSEEALIQGQEIYADTWIRKPEMTTIGPINICDYTTDSNEHLIIATNPPQQSLVYKGKLRA